MVDTERRNKLGRSEVCGLLLLVGAVALRMWPEGQSASEMPLARTILQKGDNFRVPERPRIKLRYASDYLIGLPVPGSGKPRVRYIRNQL